MEQIRKSMAGYCNVKIARMLRISVVCVSNWHFFGSKEIKI
jgi:hypothetical protein